MSNKSEKKLTNNTLLIFGTSNMFFMVEEREKRGNNHRQSSTVYMGGYTRFTTLKGAMRCIERHSIIWCLVTRRRNMCCSKNVSASNFLAFML